MGRLGGVSWYALNKGTSGGHGERHDAGSETGHEEVGDLFCDEMVRLELRAAWSAGAKCTDKGPVPGRDTGETT